MQQAELQIKAKEVDAKAAKMMADAEADLQRIAVEKERIASQERIAGAQLGAKAAADRDKLNMEQLAEGVKLGTKAISDEKNRQTQKEIAAMNRQRNQQLNQPQGGTTE